MKRKYMMVFGFISLVFAYANVLAGKVVFGYLCAVSSVMIGLLVLYVYGIFELRIQNIVVHLPMVVGCVVINNMPYEVANQLAIVGFMSVAYSFMIQMLWKDLRVVERKYLSKYMVCGSLLTFVFWLVALMFVTVNFDWVLVGNDWMIAWDALQLELLSMGVFVGSFFGQGVYGFFSLRNRVLMNSY